MKIYWNHGWQFTREGTNAAETVDLPHTVVSTPLNYFDESIYQFACTYRRTFTAPTSWQGQCVLLTVEAAAHAAKLVLNGAEIAAHGCGYTAFTQDLAPFLHYGADNVLEIRLDSRETLDVPPFGNVIDYMTYGGIYREVFVDIKPQMHIKDVFAKPRWQNGSASLTCEVTPSQPGGTWTHTLKNSEGEPCELAQVLPWHPDTPVLYTLETRLFQEGEEIDLHTVTIGFRTCEFRADGFYLNGAKYKIRGLNRHQSYAYVGYAMPESMQRHDAHVLKNELHCNAVRTSHYPQSQHFINACDELGLLVFTEIPGWQHIGGEAWQEQAVQNTRDMVLQYRNHPSIVLWGVRINESADNDALYTRTNQAAHALDDTRQTSGVRVIRQSSLLEDVYAYNDFSHTGQNAGCLPKQNCTPELAKGYFISEYNGHMFPTKTFDNEDHATEHMLRHANVLNAYYGETDIAGAFGWCMADYNTHLDFGSGDRICHHGVLDLFRGHKLAASVYAAQGDAAAVLEITSSMNIGDYPAGALPVVYAVTNADSVRVYQNDFFVREVASSDTSFGNLPHGPIALDDFVGSWGGAATSYRFEAVKNGQVVKSVTKGPMHTMQLHAEVSHTALREKTTYDVASVRLSLRDENGNLLRFANEPLQLSVSGDIALIGPDCIALQGGMGGTYVRSTGKTGQGTLTIRNQRISHTVCFTIETAQQK